MEVLVALNSGRKTYTNTESCPVGWGKSQRSKTLPTSVQDVILNNLVVRF